MTGYANRMINISNHNLNFEIKSLNGRFLTLNLSLPDILSHLEKDISSLINKNIERGAFHLKISLFQEEEIKKISYDYKSIAENINTIQNFAGLASLEKLSLSDVLSLFNPFKTESIRLFSEDDNIKILEYFEDLLSELNKYRSYEGDRLKKDLTDRNIKVNNLTKSLEKELESLELKIKKSIESKIENLFSDQDIDRNRLSQEIVYLINKHDFSEEIIRLKSHVNLFEETLNNDESNGRKLDFILQEMNREGNTIASKSRFKEITTLVIQLKTEIEKMKEQVQNVE
jgi:uncharacterized protein (TIGR00255 family)